MKIRLPRIIDDYNHLMISVYLADQLIVYYCPKIHCQQTQLPLLLQCLDVLCINSYILFKEKVRDNSDEDNSSIVDHKTFLIEFFKSLICYEAMTKA